MVIEINDIKQCLEYIQSWEITFNPKNKRISYSW